MAATRTTSTSSSSSRTPAPPSSITKEVTLPTTQADSSDYSSFQASVTMESITVPAVTTTTTATATSTTQQLQAVRSMKRRGGGNDTNKTNRNNRMLESMQIMQFYLSQQQQQQPNQVGAEGKSQQSHPSHDKKTSKRNTSGDFETDQLLNDILFQTTNNCGGGSLPVVSGTDFNSTSFQSGGSYGINFNHIFESIGSMQHQQNLFITIPSSPNDQRNLQQQQQQQLNLSPSNDAKDPSTNCTSTHLQLAAPSSPYLSSTVWKPLLQSNHLELLSYQPDRIFRERSATIESFGTSDPAQSQTPASNTTETLLLAAQHVLQEDEKNLNRHVNDQSYGDQPTIQKRKYDKSASNAIIMNSQVAEETIANPSRTQPLEKLKRSTTRPTSTTITVPNKKGKFTAAGESNHSTLGSNIDIKSSCAVASVSLENTPGVTKTELEHQQVTGIVDGQSVQLIPNVEVSNDDVLLGRGGRTNHHIGNCIYRTYKEELQETYLKATKDEKTIIANQLVKRIHDANGRFLKEYTGPIESKKQQYHQMTTGTLLYWYEVDLITARKKASQTLREINTPENRLAKRLKYGSSAKKK